MINCRSAMLAMNLTPDGMAQLLGLSRSKIIELCFADAPIPARLEHRVSLLLGPYRIPAAEAQPIMEAVDEMLYYLADRKGVATFKEIENEYGLTGAQLKNIELVEAWVTLHWEEKPKRYGIQPCVYLTSAGYQKIGRVMQADAAAPSKHAVPVSQTEHLNTEARVLLESIEMQMHTYYRNIDDLKTMRVMVIAQVTTVDLILSTYGHLLAPIQPQQQITHDEEGNENED